MTISPTPLLSEILGDDPIPAGKRAYFEQLLRNELHELVLEEFLRQERTQNLTRRKLADRIGKLPEQITRWLAAPGNWTLDTVSDLLLGMRAKLQVAIVGLADDHVVAPKHVFEWTVGGNSPTVQSGLFILAQPSASNPYVFNQVNAPMQIVATPQPSGARTETDIPSKIFDQRQVPRSRTTKLLEKLAA